MKICGEQDTKEAVANLMTGFEKLSIANVIELLRLISFLGCLGLTVVSGVIHRLFGPDCVVSRVAQCLF